jgi:hypothetical protein
MIHEWPCKFPEEEEIMGLLWSGKLATDEKIVASSFTVIEGDNALLLSDEAISDDFKSTSVLVKGGTQNGFYIVRNHITTDSVPARKLARDARLHVR